MAKRMPSGKHCEICGKELRRNNISGICRKPECKRLRAAKNGRALTRSGQFKCTVPGCPKTSRTRGYCHMHYRRVRMTGDPGPAESSVSPTIVHAGDRFGRWTALENYMRTNVRLPCRCDCGTERPVAVGTLVSGKSRSCGCLAGTGIHGRMRSDPYVCAGEVFGRLTALEDAPHSRDHIRCRCECGTVSLKLASSLRLRCKSCGCLRREAFRTHGLSGHPLYKTWRGMIRRTTCPEALEYANYGGRGINVCERWLGAPEGFLNFIADVGERPPGSTLDRTDNERGYSPDNVEWATPKQQGSNRRTVSALTRERNEALAQVQELREALAAARGTLS